MGKIGFIVSDTIEEEEKTDQLEQEKEPSEIPAYTENMTPEDEIKAFMEWFEVVKGYDKRLEMLEMKTDTMLESMKAEETEISFSQLVGIGVFLSVLTFLSVALALKVVA